MFTAFYTWAEVFMDIPYGAYIHTADSFVRFALLKSPSERHFRKTYKEPL